MTTTITYPQPVAVPIVSTNPATFSANPVDTHKNRGFGRLVKTELKVWLRHPGTWATTLLMPVGFIMLNGLMNPYFATAVIDEPDSVFRGLTALQFLLPMFLMMGATIPFLGVIPAEIGGHREKGILKRLSASPMKPASLIAAHYVINLLAVLTAALLAIVIPALIWGLTWPQNIGTVALGFILGTLAMAAIGTLIAARVSKASVGMGIGNAALFLMLILGGAIGGAGVHHTNQVLSTIARFSPFGAAQTIMEYGWHGIGAAGFPIGEVIALLAWIIVPAVAGLKLFRWR